MGVELDHEPDPDRRLTADEPWAVAELRQYTLHPGARDVLIELFDREFVESQEAAGMRLIGQFRDLDDPNRFVWLRAFPDMTARRRALESFYGGSVWKAHSAAANATMVDVSDVLLLRPVRPAFGCALDGPEPPRRARDDAGVVVATIYELEEAASADFPAVFESRVAPVLARAGAPLLATLATEPSANTYPALPVREGERAFVSFCSFPSLAAYERHAADLVDSSEWDAVSEALGAGLLRPPQVLRLSPTPRSRLRA